MLDKFFNPNSVAIVGASRQKGKVGYEILRSLLDAGFPGDVFPVNPQADSIENLKCFPELKSIGKTPDLVLIVVPAKAVPDVMQQCASVGVKAVVIITAGFREVGEEGRKLEQQVIQLAKQGGIRVIGPNCLGLIVPSKKLNASFGGALPPAGATGYLSQSGALMAAILDMANAAGFGFSALVSIGNKADVDELEIIEHLADDPGTKVIAGYLESISDGNAFIREAECISQKKPILLMKAGVTPAGAKAASSHTGSLAGSETAYEAVFERAGVIRCFSLASQFDFAKGFASQPLPKGNSVAVITNAGGAGIMTADAIEKQQLTFAKLNESTIKRLAEKLPPAANLYNPIDVLGDALPDRYEFALDVALDDPNVDSVIVLLTPQAMTDPAGTAKAVARVVKNKPGKPVFACFLGAGKVAEANAILRNASIPQYDSPEAVVLTIKVMSDYVRWKNRPKRIVKLFSVNRHKVETIIQRHLRRGLAQVGEAESKEILQAYGFLTPKDAIAATAEQAVNIAEQIGYPVVLKIWSPDIIHKSDVGGVRVGLETPQDVMDAFDLMLFRIPRKIPQAKILGVLVQQMCSRGRELILGMNRDPHFGPLMMFGMGGTMVEVMQDVSFYLAPLTGEEARQMLMSTRTYKLLIGARGEKGVDIEAVAEALQRLSQLVTEFPEIQEMDINPFIVGPEGVTPVAVDARIRVEKT